MEVITEAARLVSTNKAKLAFLAPLIVALGGAVANWIITGTFDATEVRLAAGGAVLAATSGVAAYFATPGEVVVNVKAVEAAAVEGRTP